MSWYNKTINSNGSSTCASTLLTPAHVTVSTNNERFVYNIEYKENKPEKTVEKLEKQLSRHRNRKSVSTIGSTSNTFAAASVVAARFQHHTRNHSRSHSRKISSESNISNFSDISTFSVTESSMWDEWIMKYLDKNNIVDDESPIEDWIFNTKE